MNKADTYEEDQDSPVSIAPDMAWGQPCLDGTRFPVHIIFENLAAGMSVDDLMEEFPQLDREQVLATIRYAGESLGRHARRLHAKGPIVVHRKKYAYER